MPKATIREGQEVLGAIVRNEWDELAEAIGTEIGMLFASGRHAASLDIQFEGMAMTEWEALPEETRRDLQEYGADG